MMGGYREEAGYTDAVWDRPTDPAKRKPTWQCKFCGKFYSERTAKDHAYCVQEQDRRNAEGFWP